MGSQVRGLYDILFEEVIFPFLISPLCPIYCAWKHSYPCPYLVSQSHFIGFQSKGGLHCFLQRRFFILYIVALDLAVSLLQEQSTVPGIELYPSPESLNQVYFDNTGGRPIFRVGHSGVRDLQHRLLEWQMGDFPIQNIVCNPPENVWGEGVMNILLCRTKILSNSWGDDLGKISLLLKGLLQTSIGYL